MADERSAPMINLERTRYRGPAPCRDRTGVQQLSKQRAIKIGREHPLLLKRRPAD